MFLLESSSFSGGVSQGDVYCSSHLDNVREFLFNAIAADPYLILYNRQTLILYQIEDDLMEKMNLRARIAITHRKQKVSSSFDDLWDNHDGRIEDDRIIFANFIVEIDFPELPDHSPGNGVLLRHEWSGRNDTYYPDGYSSLDI